MAKTPTDIRSLARSHTIAAINVLKSIMNQTKASDAARVSAALGLLDRGWGKPTQTMDMTVHKPARELTDSELTIIAAGGSLGVEAASDDPKELH